MAFSKIVGFDVSPRTPAVDERRELARDEQPASHVVVPDALSEAEGRGEPRRSRVRVGPVHLAALFCLVDIRSSFSFFVAVPTLTRAQHLSRTRRCKVHAPAWRRVSTGARGAYARVRRFACWSRSSPSRGTRCSCCSCSCRCSSRWRASAPRLAKRLGLPAVVGELAAGIALGPTGFGHWFPNGFAAIFPPTTESFHLLDAFSAVGMTMLLLLTGLETDVRLLRNLGRAALIASMMGMVLPFGLGFGLGYLMPASYLADPGSRILFSLFIATAMSISAMPVIAKILVDLDLTKRNIGIVILSAGVVDDTVGWLVLSLIAGAATHGAVNVHDLGAHARRCCWASSSRWSSSSIRSCASLIARHGRALPHARLGPRRDPRRDVPLRRPSPSGSACTPSSAPSSPGVVLHQVPRLRRETVARLESVTYGVLAPIFLGLVGIKVNLWSLAGGRRHDARPRAARRLRRASSSGCSLGAYWGGLRFWEAASIAVAMNARGAMEIVVATIGLSLGILTPQMFAIIVHRRHRDVVPRAARPAPHAAARAHDRRRGQAHRRRRVARRLRSAARAPPARDERRPQRAVDRAARLRRSRAAATPPCASSTSRSAPSWWRRLLHRFAQHAPGNVTDQMEAFRAMANGKPPELGQLSGGAGGGSPSSTLAAGQLDRWSRCAYGARPG